MATLQNLGVLKYRDKAGNWKPLPVVLQSSGDGGGGISTISGKGQPTESTVGRLNQLYRDESTDKLYICTGVEGGYTWAAVVSDTEDAVTYTAQTLTNAQKAQARSNIGAGTSSFSGSYNDLADKPNIPAASVIDTTLTKAGYAADAKAAGDAIEKKLDATALPTAINDALAQAKASGEFDGPKGDKGDTGPVGPKGADGKDGAGMDVTGAKVGQIAKIKAVDDSGKPTAWEAIEETNRMKWKKICDIVIGEDDGNVAAISTSTMPDGTPISESNITEIIFVGYMQIEEASSYSYGTFFVNEASIIIGQNFGVNTSGKSYFRGRFAVIGDGYAFAEWSNGQGVNNAISGGGININPHYYGANSPDIADKYNFTKITSIKVTGPKSTSGIENDIKLARLLVYGR